MSIEFCFQGGVRGADGEEVTVVATGEKREVTKEDPSVIVVQLRT